MNPVADQKRKDAIRALINIAILEGFVLIAVVGVYLYTNSIVYLVGGIVASSLIFFPMFLRWHRAHGKGMSVKPNSDPEARS